ncbi:MAG: hypothetical protein EOM24_10875 [Chloroflexia bacterium]|nr:hypothetical protein [Chloroflexia bacterium]
MPVKRPFCALAADELLLLEPERTLAIHVQRDRVKGRAWIERKEMDATETPAGTVFRYEALEAGQWFAGVVVCDAAADAQALAQLLASSDTAWLGRSRSATYGKVRLQVEGVQEDWSETPAPPKPPSRQQTLTLLSDTLLRDAEGNLVEVLDDATLAAYLGAEVRLDPARTVLHTTMVGGFNRTWQLPVNQERALAAGSVIGFTLEAGTLDRAALERAGIGERRSEGYGRLAFHWLDAPTYQAVNVEGKRGPTQSAAPETGQGAALNLPPTDQALAATMARRLFEREVDQAIIAFVQRHVWPRIDAETDAPGLLPSNSQLARLRVLVRRAQAIDDTAMVAREFARFRPFARTGYERAHLAQRTETLAAWIERLLQEPARVWQELGAVKQIAVAAVSVEPTEAQARAATLRLLAAVLVAPAQRRKTLRTTPTEVIHG